MYQNIESYPCVRLLNLSGEIGCSSKLESCITHSLCCLERLLFYVVNSCVKLCTCYLKKRMPWLIVLIRGLTNWLSILYNRSWSSKGSCSHCKAQSQRWALVLSISYFTSHREVGKFVPTVWWINCFSMLSLMFWIFKLRLNNFDARSSFPCSSP